MSSVSEDIKPVGGGPDTFINVFEVPVKQIDTFIAQWRERAKIMSTALGFLDSRLHRALSSRTRFQVVNVAHWDSRQAWEAAAANPDKPACVLWPTTPKRRSPRTEGPLPGRRLRRS